MILELFAVNALSIEGYHLYSTTHRLKIIYFRYKIDINEHGD